MSATMSTLPSWIQEKAVDAAVEMVDFQAIQSDATVLLPMSVLLFRHCFAQLGACQVVYLARVNGE